MVNVEPDDVPPPGPGFVTVTSTSPAAAMSLAGIAAEIWVELKKLVASALPLNFTTDFASKCAPSIVSVKAAPPAPCGVHRADIAGIGLVESLILKT